MLKSNSVFLGGKAAELDFGRILDVGPTLCIPPSCISIR